MPKPSKPANRKATPTQGRANLARLRRVSDAEIARTSPTELRAIPNDFWQDARVVTPREIGHLCHLAGVRIHGAEQALLLDAALVREVVQHEGLLRPVVDGDGAAADARRRRGDGHAHARQHRTWHAAGLSPPY